MEDLTPAMRQYMEIKNKYKDCVVFFRMGDFYETFYDDAKVTSKALDIALTRRGIKNSEKEIPLAGIPYHALDSYLSKMIKQGIKVVIVEQLEDPRFAKGIVKRDVIRVVTPGTVIEQNVLGKNNNFIASILPGQITGLSFVDLTTGEFFCTEFESNEEAVNELLKYMPSEILLPSSLESNKKISQMLRERGFYLTFRTDVDFYFENAKNNLMKQFKVVSLDGYGLKGKDSAVSASGALLSYLYETQRNAVSHLNSIKYTSSQDYMFLDNTTIRNLELLKSLRDNSEKITLFSVLDKTTTYMGSRLLRKLILKPLLDTTKINERLLAVEELFTKQFILDELRDLLKNISDIERLISRINLDNSNPRDLVALHGSIELIPEIKKVLNDAESGMLVKLSEMDELRHIAKLIDDSIIDDPPISIQEGGFIREGYNEELDKLREISHNAKKVISQIEEKERNSTGIRSLKIRYNQVFGYYIDVTKPNISMVPQYFIKKQTLVNSERFITEELKVLEEQILTAEERIMSLEQELFKEIVSQIKKETEKIQHIADNISYLDVLSSFALVSMKNNYKKPVITKDYRLRLHKSRHPVIETITPFVDNDVVMNEDNRIMIITGPNMAGKSVYMRQVAINILMAQIGCFVPCEEAEIGIITKIFCRTGASDDISQGQSTFMVEMAETAQILNNADEKSLIILDEIGRGTSTFDGVAIAWAVAEYIASKIKAKTMFATHYHVLNELEKHVKGVKNYNIAVNEKEDKIIFLRKILEGGTDKSYGIHVAKLAGMPPEVIDKSREIQFKLENEDEISEKIIIETRKSKEKDKFRKEIEEVDRLIKSKQKRLDEI
jgi:DNA mismatch repair protein MutS